MWSLNTAAAARVVLLLVAAGAAAGDQGKPADVNPVIVPDGFEKIHPRIEDGRPILSSFCGGFLCSLQDGRLLNVYHAERDLEVTYSSDAGETWTRPETIRSPSAEVKFGRPSALQTRDGAIWIFTYGWVRWSTDPVEAKSDIWVVRSSDNGRTWDGPRLVWRTYTGMTQGAIETRRGHILFPFCHLGPKLDDAKTVRFVDACLASTDHGESWRCADNIDIPPEADAEMRNRVNGGAIEPSIVELEDGRVWMAIRTVTGYLWESFSEDEGLSWSAPRTTSISCGGPVYITRLPTSQRIVMVWNQADWTLAKNWSGWPNGYASASIALSDDDGKTWRKPAVYARGGRRTVHSMIVEYAPGKLLINMMERRIFLRTTESRLLDPRP